MKKHNINSLTLDNKHNEYSKKFKNNQEILIPKLNQQIINLENSLNSSNKKNKEETLEKIKKLKNKISYLEREEKEYYLNNSKYIFSYFEDKKNIDNNDSPAKNVSNTKNELVNNFFNISNNNNNNNNNTNNTNTDEKILNDEKKIKNNKDNVDKYFYSIDNNFINIDKYVYNGEICKNCRKGEMIYVENEGVTICNKCSISAKYLIENDKPSYKEPPKEVCFYAYKRINHLREILAQFQAKESTNIPDEVLNAIKNQIKKERISIEDLTNKKTKEILKNLGYNKYYEHIPFIKDKLGIKPPIMSSELEETLCNLFIEIQKPYSKYCPKDRVNFLNYYFTLYKLCELLGETKFLPFFPMLKDREKRVEQDQIWKKICDELKWEFISTP